jgi:hypothetical protein
MGRSQSRRSRSESPTDVDVVDGDHRCVSARLVGGGGEVGELGVGDADGVDSESRRVVGIEAFDEVLGRDQQRGSTDAPM